MRQAKVDAGWRCKACGRKRRDRPWKIWRPREINAHHLFRVPGSPLVSLCRFCHMRVAHRLDRASPLPLVIDTWLAIGLVRLARYAVLIGIPLFLLWKVA
jgi:hypothetical protein